MSNSYYNNLLYFINKYNIINFINFMKLFQKAIIAPNILKITTFC